VEFNQISLEESYEAFDTDEDDKLSLPDLQAAVHTLGLDIHGDAVLELFAALDPAGLGYIQRDVWSDAIRAAGGGATVLRARGIHTQSYLPHPSERPQQGTQLQELHATHATHAHGPTQETPLAAAETVLADPEADSAPAAVPQQAPSIQAVTAQSVKAGPPEPQCASSEDNARQSSVPQQTLETCAARSRSETADKALLASCASQGGRSSPAPSMDGLRMLAGQIEDASGKQDSREPASKTEDGGGFEVIRGGGSQLEANAPIAEAVKTIHAHCQSPPDAESASEEMADAKSVTDQCMPEQEWQVVNQARAALEDARDSIARLAVDSGKDFCATSGADRAGSDDTSEAVVTSSDQAASESCDAAGSQFTRMAGITVKLAIDFSAAGAIGSTCRANFERDLCQDLANASGALLPSCFQVKSVSPGSVIADVKILSTDAGPDPMDVAVELEEQASDLNSPLRSGAITRFVESIHQIPIPMVTQVEEALGTISHEKVEASGRIFEKEHNGLLEIPKSETLPLCAPSAPAAVDSSDAVQQATLSQTAPIEVASEKVRREESQSVLPIHENRQSVRIFEKEHNGLLEIPKSETLPLSAPSASAAVDSSEAVQQAKLSQTAPIEVASEKVRNEESQSVLPIHENRQSVGETDKQIAHDVAERQEEIVPSNSDVNDSAISACIGRGDADTGHQDTSSTTQQGQKRNCCRHRLRPLPKSSRSKKKVTPPMEESSTKSQSSQGQASQTEAKDKSLGTHLKVTSDDKRPSAEKELLILRESHETLLQRVRILEAALQNKPTSVSIISEQRDHQQHKGLIMPGSSGSYSLPAEDKITGSGGQFARMRNPAADATKLPQPQAQAVQKASGDGDAQKTPQLPLLSDEYRSRMSATSTSCEPSVTVQAIQFNSGAPTSENSYGDSVDQPTQAILPTSKGLAASRRNDWDEEMRRLQLLEVADRPQSRNASDGGRQQMCDLSLTSNDNIKTPRSVGSLPSRAESAVPSLLCGNMESGEIVGAAKQIMKDTDVITAVSHEVSASEVRKGQENHRDRLALRAERYRPASPSRREISSMDRSNAAQPSGTCDTARQDVGIPPSNPEAVGAWWERKDREPKVEESAGRRLLPWERDAARFERGAIHVVDASSSAARIGEEKVCIVL